MGLCLSFSLSVSTTNDKIMGARVGRIREEREKNGKTNVVGGDKYYGLQVQEIGDSDERQVGGAAGAESVSTRAQSNHIVLLVLCPFTHPHPHSMRCHLHYL